jgi:hypothetical protein
LHPFCSPTVFGRQDRHSSESGKARQKTQTGRKQILPLLLLSLALALPGQM